MTVPRFSPHRLVLAACLLASTAALATDKTDLYYNPSESGWGMTIANQGDTIFVTIYVYGQDNLPTWLVGTATRISTDSSGVNTYSGDLFRTQGPYYGLGAFSPGSVVATKAGTYTYRETSVNGGQITYSVGTTTVIKNIQRQTLATNPNVVGIFAGAYYSTVSGCNNSSLNGSAFSFVNIAITGTPAATQLGMLFSTNVVCSVSSAYSQSGRMGQMSGTWSCTPNGATGNTNIFEIEAGANALSGRFTTTYSSNGCTENGFFSGVRVPNQ